MIAHLAGLVFAAIVVGPTGDESLAERAFYVTSHPTAWTASWLVWDAAAIVLIGFFALLRAELRDRGLGAGTSLALVCVVVGAIVEIVGHTVNAWLVPAAAMRGDLAAMANLEVVARTVASLAPELLYGAAVFLFLRQLARAGAGRFALGAGRVNLVSDVSFAVVATAGVVALMPIATVLLVASLCVFQLSLVIGSAALERD